MAVRIWGSPGRWRDGSARRARGEDAVVDEPVLLGDHVPELLPRGQGLDQPVGQFALAALDGRFDQWRLEELDFMRSQYFLRLGLAGR